MKKQNLLFILILGLGLLGFNAHAQTVNETVSVFWAFNLGTDGQTATYSEGAEGYFRQDYVTFGSNLGIKPMSQSSVAYTGFQPVAQSDSPGENDNVNFITGTKTGLTFKPTSVSFKCMRFGTDGGLVNVLWKSADGTITTIQAGLRPNRNNDLNGYTDFKVDISDIAASSGESTLILQIYTLGNTKQIAFADVKIDGIVEGSTGVPVDAVSDIFWLFDLGTAGQTATYTEGTKDYFGQDYVTIGSNFKSPVVKSKNDINYTGFDPNSKSNSPTDNDYISFVIKPKTGLSFTPTQIVFDCMRFGTGGGKINVLWKSTDGTITTIATDVIPGRDSDTQTGPGTHYESVSIPTLPASNGECMLMLQLYSLDPGKQVGFANIKVTGNVKGTLSDVTIYNITTAVSPIGAGSVNNTPAGTEFDENSEVKYTATENFGYDFSH